MAEKPRPGPVPPKPAGQTPPATFDLRQPLIVLRAHLLVATAIALVVCTLVAWAQMRRPRLYMAEASLVVERNERSEGREYTASMINELVVSTRLEQLRSPELLDRVVASLSPEEQELVQAGFPSAGLRGGNPAARVKGIVHGAIAFTRKPETTLIDITAVHRNPQAAAFLANRYAQEAVKDALDRNVATSDASLTFLRNQADDMRKKAETAERALQEYRQHFNMVSLEASQNIIVDNLKSLNASATAARVARMAIEAQLQQVETVLKRGDDPTQLATVKGFETLADVAKRLSDLRAKRAVMSERYGRRHPAMLENESSIEALEKVRDQQVETAVAGLRSQRDKASNEEKQLVDQRNKAEKEALQLDEVGVKYNILRREVDSATASYSQILSRLNDAVITAQLRGINFRISELATPPAAPFSPNAQKALLITGALAIAILLGYPFSAEMFFGRIRSAADVEYHLGTELLGEIGSVSKVEERDRPFLVKSDEDEAASEQFRALYSQLSLTSKIDPPKAILITSTAPGEGKSFIAANLAECFVAHGRRTLLVDADLRRPAQHRNFKLDNKAGIIRWLENNGSLEGDLLKDEKLGIVEIHPGLYVLRAGGLSRRASELMETGRLSALLTTLQRQFDITILDTPPAGIFPDAISFARVCNELIYICRFNMVSRQAVRDVLDRMRQTELDIPGVVLNAMPAGFGGTYYYKGYSYQRAKYYSRHYQEQGKS
jgi:succinoglycan biosynthesis transport protein ExoP